VLGRAGCVGVGVDVPVGVDVGVDVPPHPQLESVVHDGFLQNPW